MCQSRAQGGRRCSVHHPATLAMKFLIRNNVTGQDLEQGQVDHIFKQLKEAGRRRHTPSIERYRDFLEEQKQAIQNSDISETKKNQIIQRLERAIESDQVPNGSHFYALTRMPSQASNLREEIDMQLTAYRRLTGKSRTRVKREFKRMYDHLVTTRSESNHIEGYDPDGVLDEKTARVFNYMNNSVTVQYEDTPRITRQRTGLVTVREYGYDPEDGRLEVLLNNGRVYSYHSIPEETYEAFQSSPTVVFSDIRTSGDYDYSSQEEAERDGYRVYCNQCQQYRIASGHPCEANDGRTTGQVIRRDIDAIYSSVAENLTRPSTTNRNSIQPVAGPWRSRTRTSAEFPEDSYEYTQGTQGRNPSHAQRITPNYQALMQQVDQGNAVNFNLGRRIYTAGTGRREHNDVTVPVTAQLEDGNYNVILRYDSANARCTCEVYQRNRDCTHLHPGGGDRLNRFVRRDIDAALTEIMQTSDQNHSVHLASSYYPSSTTIRAELNNEERLPNERISEILHELSTNPNQPVRMVLTEGGVPTSELNISAFGESFRVTGNENYQNGTSPAQAREQVREAIGTSAFASARLRERAESVMGMGWETNRERREAYMRRFRENAAHNGYLANTDEFISDYRAAEALPLNSPERFHVGPVTNGYLSTGPGRNARGFGIEIEFDGDTTAVNRVIRDLNTRGLSNRASMARYHERNNFQNWRVERDGSVAAEIVSPILYDNEESWNQVRQVCELVRAAGGRASVRTGNHVHIGANGFNVDDRRGVLAAVSANQDVIRRVATDPVRRSHRTSEGNSYSSPFTDRDISAAYQARNAHYNSYSYSIIQHRYRMANFTNENTIEFRDPDGSLDAGHIQANVMMASALMQAGQNGTWGDLDAHTTHAQRVGANALRQPYIQNAIEDEEERILASNISLMTTLDSLFPDRESRQRILNIVARVPWQEGR